MFKDIRELFELRARWLFDGRALGRSLREEGGAAEGQDGYPEARRLRTQNEEVGQIRSPVRACRQNVINAGIAHNIRDAAHVVRFPFEARCIAQGIALNTRAPVDRTPSECLPIVTGDGNDDHGHTIFGPQLKHHAVMWVLRDRCAVLCPGHPGLVSFCLQVGPLPQEEEK